MPPCWVRLIRDAAAAEDPEDRGGSYNSTCFRWIGLVLITRFCELLMCFILNTPSNVIDIEHTRATVCCEQSWYDEKILLKGDAADISLNVFHLKKVFFVRDLLTVVLSGEQIQITFTQRDFLSRLLKPWVQRQMEKNDFSGKTSPWIFLKGRCCCFVKFPKWQFSFFYPLTHLECVAQS